MIKRIIYLMMMFLVCSIPAVMADSLNYDLKGKLKKVFIEEEKTITDPPGAFVKVFSWDSHLSNSEFCLVFKTPLKEKKGVLMLIKNKDCTIANLENSQVLMNDVSAIRLNIRQQNYYVHTQSAILVFTFPFSSLWTSFSLEERISGSITDGIYCRKFDGQCKNEVKETCHSCQTPFFTTSLNRNCANKSQRRCGRISCGRKNEIACLKYLSNQKKLSCDEAKKHVYCVKGRIPYCEPSGRLICK